MVQPQWKSALHKFLQGWLKREYVIGVLLTGSYAAGTPTMYSDIDIHIILSDKIKWRERGMKVVDGIEIEYFANPVRRFPKCFRDNYRDGRRINARMFSMGKILYDKTGDVAKIQKQARKMMKVKFRKPHPLGMEVMKYEIWDNLDNLKDVYERNSSNFYYCYYYALHEILRTYCKYFQVELPAPARLHRFLYDEQFLKKYLIKPFPDKVFTRLLKKCLVNKTPKTSLHNLQKLAEYTLKITGGFQSDGWKIRVTAD